jgi:PAS domain S-box-containing protein
MTVRQEQPVTEKVTIQLLQLELAQCRSALVQEDRRIAQLEESAQCQQTSHQTLSESSLTEAIDTIPGLVWSVLPNGEVDFLNLRWREYTGLTLTQANGWGWSAAIHPDDLMRLDTYWRSVLASDQPGEIEARLRRFDGSFRWFLFRAVPLFDAAGKLCKWYGQNIDIDDRKRAEERLRQSEAYLAEAQRLSLTGSFGLKIATGELIWSEQTFLIMGYDRATTPTLARVLDRVHPDDLGIFQETIERATREQIDSDFEHRLLMPDASVKHVHVKARAAKTEHGELEFVGAVMDITERKQAAEALRASEHVARGQSEALTRVLSIFARVSEPENFLEHILLMIGSQLGAHSISVWELNTATGRVQFLANCMDGALHLSTPGETQASSQPNPSLNNHPIWMEFFQTGAHCVAGRIEADTILVRIADQDDSPWYPWFADIVINPTSQAMAKQLYALGVIATLAVPILIAGKVTGLISIQFTEERRFKLEEIELTRALAHQAMLAIQLMRLSQQSRQVAVIAERNRMARDIHDTLAQGFTGVIVQLEATADATAKGLHREAEAHLSRAGLLARASLNEARRSVRALRPQALEDKNLAEALAELIQTMTAGTTLKAEFQLQGAPQILPLAFEENLLRIAQEVLTNALRHAQASLFVACLNFDALQVSMELRDNGCGFDPIGRYEGFGLLGMQERVDAMGGQITIQSLRGTGTTIVVVLPLNSSLRDSSP